MKTKREKKLEELIEHYEKELKRTATYLHVHNMSCSDEAAEKGERLKSDLASMEEPEVSEEDARKQAKKILWAVMEATRLGEPMATEITIIENGLKQYAQQQDKELPKDGVKECQKAEEMLKEYILKTGYINKEFDDLPDRIKRKISISIIKDMHDFAASELRKELIKFANHITAKEFPYAIAHGEKEPFCNVYGDFTTDKITDDYLNNK